MKDHGKSFTHAHPLTVAIIGAGFCGISVSRQLIYQTNIPLNLLIFDDSLYAGKGVAYTTDCPLHLLNVPACNMGISHANPEHFYHWLEEHQDRWRNLDPSFLKLELQPYTFLPRMVYGSYLEDVRQDMEACVIKKGVSIHYLSERVEEIKIEPDGSLEIVTSKGASYFARKAVLATSVPHTQSLSTQLSLEEGYLNSFSPYLTKMQHASKLIEKHTSSSQIAIVGSGLTMLDAVATLYHVNYPGKITIFSSKGLLPQPHRLPSAAHPPLEIDEWPREARALCEKVHAGCMASQKSMGDWRPFIDAMRHITSTIWQQFPPAEKRRTVRHLLSIWNTFRHRTSLDTLSYFKAFEQQGRLERVKAHVISLEKRDSAEILLKVFRRGEQEASAYLADLVVNCSGPQLELGSSSSPLIAHLLKENLLERDAMGMGVAICPRGSAKGRAENRLFPIGSFLFGTYFETTAVPELRQQAHHIATQILEREFR